MVIVGFSRIGSRVVRLLRDLDLARVLVVDPVADPAAIRAAGAEPAPLADALPQADVLSLHAPALPETRHMIGAAQLAALPEHAVLVNTARGSLVDTAALEAACTAGLHAVLDVTEPEPLPPTHRCTPCRT
ncbi:NAD(P)-dependent oxidoreductase [Streptomyces sp. NPDC052013]|uniref:NAD(P)-dependent oxidoreductase n=1 Tax=Streptomyces sp. NPDC052013 TaxID=3365679 RepID=UPI0037CDB50B